MEAKVERHKAMLLVYVTFIFVFGTQGSVKINAGGTHINFYNIYENIYPGVTQT